MTTRNTYGRELTADEIAARAHRELVGGMWDEIGALQLDFLRAQGLAPSHRLVDVGCGALRGGVHFVRFLEPGGYHGLDVNASLIAAGERELAAASLADRGAHLLVDDRFAVSRFGQRFEFALAVSLFTHLAMNHIVRCMVEVAKVLAPSGRFFASWFEAPAAAWLAPITHPPAGIVTHYDADAYHYAFAELAFLAGNAGLRAVRIGDWNHPRGQQMAMFTRDE